MKLGLYYEIIVGMFPSMEWDEMYGAAVCAQPPFNLIILPFWWITMLPLSKDFLLIYNKFLCHMLYLPIALVVTLIFTIFNTMYVPIAWIKHIIALLRTLVSTNETLDEWSEKFVRLKTILFFIIFGPIILMLSLPIDSLVFFYNLYTIPTKAEYLKRDQDLITAKELEDMKICC
jgi:hypothetical protein